jgi:hypothetical protein
VGKKCQPHRATSTREDMLEAKTLLKEIGTGESTLTPKPVENFTLDSFGKMGKRKLPPPIKIPAESKRMGHKKRVQGNFVASSRYPHKNRSRTTRPNTPYYYGT